MRPVSNTSNSGGMNWKHILDYQGPVQTVLNTYTLSIMYTPLQFSTLKRVIYVIAHYFKSSFVTIPEGQRVDPS